MSYLDELKNQTRAELVDIAKDYGISVAGKNKTELAEAIFKFESGVGGDDVEIKPVETKVAKTDDVSDLQLIKFTGINNNFQLGDFVFSRKNPFLAVPARVASHAYRTWPQKFRPASPDEVQQFYS